MVLLTALAHFNCRYRGQWNKQHEICSERRFDPWNSRYAYVALKVNIDGANIEIREEVKDENIWLFGALAHEIEEIRHSQRFHGVKQNPDLANVVQRIRSGDFGHADVFHPLMDTLTHDFYCVSYDFAECTCTSKC